MKQSPLEFYTAQIELHTQELNVLKKKLTASSILRLLVFLAICFAVYLAFGDTRMVIAIILAGIVSFVWMVTRHSNLQYQRDLKKALIAENETEMEVLSGAFKHLPAGEHYNDPTHAFCQDIDLFGRGSFYQFINRTALASGSELLAALLKANDIENIPKKQEAISELSGKATWRQHYAAIASLVTTEVASDFVTDWLRDYKRFVPKGIKAISYGFSILSALLLGLYFFDQISGYIVFGWFLLGLAISGRYLKKVNELSSKTNAIQSTFEQFYKLIAAIEAETFTSEVLSEKRNFIITSNRKASAAMKQFAKHLDALDQRANMLIGVIANGFMLRDLLQSYHIEKWISGHKELVGAWFETVTFFDAYNSLANYAFNHPDAIFPKISHGHELLQIKGAAHPLLNPDIAIRNDIQINNEEFFIVTGANMAGKSTFLRTVALQIVMGNVGLPTNATAAVYNPVKLITSMRTTDSLTDDESYFFSELKRLKFIVDAIETDRYFIILDEILKGTNSTDKAIGSRKFVEKLVAGNSTGIIATHDLSLCEVSEKLPEVKNYYFDARIEAGELYFDYTFKPGICQNMNASFLLKKMNIVD